MIISDDGVHQKNKNKKKQKLIIYTYIHAMITGRACCSEVIHIHINVKKMYKKP